jgi:hypothetical protein
MKTGFKILFVFVIFYWACKPIEPLNNPNKIQNSNDTLRIANDSLEYEIAIN